jgi:hypothetical protein
MLTESLKRKHRLLFHDTGKSVRRGILNFIQKRRTPHKSINSKIIRSFNGSVISMEGMIKEINYDFDYVIIDLKEKAKDNKFYSFTFPTYIVKEIENYQEDDVVTLQARLDAEGVAEEVVLKKIEDQHLKIQFYKDYAASISQ